jgi:uncharacterized protein (TIGR03067 family)
VDNPLPLWRRAHHRGLGRLGQRYAIITGVLKTMLSTGIIIAMTSSFLAAPPTTPMPVDRSLSATVRQAGGKDAKTDKELLQGAWQATAAVINGESVPKEKRPHLMVAGDKLTVFPRDRENQPGMDFKFTVDARKTPKTITVTRLVDGIERKSGIGIYAFQNGTLKLCLPIRKEAAQPTDFAAPANSGLMLLTLTKSRD